MSDSEKEGWEIWEAREKKGLALTMVGPGELEWEKELTKKRQEPGSKDDLQGKFSYLLEAEEKLSKDRIVWLTVLGDNKKRCFSDVNPSDPHQLESRNFRTMEPFFRLKSDQLNRLLQKKWEGAESPIKQEVKEDVANQWSLLVKWDHKPTDDAMELEGQRAPEGDAAGEHPRPALMKSTKWRPLDAVAAANLDSDQEVEVVPHATPTQTDAPPEHSDWTWKPNFAECEHIKCTKDGSTPTTPVPQGCPCKNSFLGSKNNCEEGMTCDPFQGYTLNLNRGAAGPKQLLEATSEPGEVAATLKVEGDAWGKGLGLAGSGYDGLPSEEQIRRCMKKDQGADKVGEGALELARTFFDWKKDELSALLQSQQQVLKEGQWSLVTMKTRPRLRRSNQKSEEQIRGLLGEEQDPLLERKYTQIKPQGDADEPPDEGTDEQDEASSPSPPK